MPAAAGVTYMIEERRERIQAIMAQNDIGIDLGTTTIIIAQEGKGVLFISSEIEEMLRTCNRLAVLRDGAKVGELSGEMTQEKVMKTIAEG